MMTVKPCPFCGAEPGYLSLVGEGHGLWIQCEKCYANGPKFYTGSFRKFNEVGTATLNKWNQRDE